MIGLQYDPRIASLKSFDNDRLPVKYKKEQVMEDGRDLMKTRMMQGRTVRGPEDVSEI